MWRDEEIRGDPGDTAALTCIDEGVGDDESTANDVDDDGEFFIASNWARPTSPRVSSVRAAAKKGQGEQLAVLSGGHRWSPETVRASPCT